MSDTTLALARRLSHEQPISGEALAEALGCSRAAVWKHVAALRELGVAVEAQAGQGYQLAEPLELLSDSTILDALAAFASDRERDEAAPTVSEPQGPEHLLEALEVVEVTGSTNADLLARPEGAAHRVALLAERQTSGRGRRGRQWVSPFARNLYLSLGWRFEAGLGALGLLPLVVAVAVARAVERVGLADHGLKWPNDIVTPRGKLGGCLVEVRGDLGGPCDAVLGVGLNVRLAGAPGTSAIDQSWDQLATIIPDISRNVLAATLLHELLRCVHRFEVHGFDAPVPGSDWTFAEEWRRFDTLAGREVELIVEGPGEGALERGRCLGLGSRGGLLLERDGQTIERLAGEARLRPGR